MTSIKKIATITYATIKHLQGYKLLKNPKGTNPCEVNMIKYRRNLTPECDEVFFYTRINRTIGSSFLKSNNKHIISTRIFDTDNLKMSKKKNIVLYGGGVDGYLRSREDVEEHILSKRKKLNLKTKLKIADILDMKENLKYYLLPESNWDIFSEFLTLENIKLPKDNIYQKVPKKDKGFLQILKENLSNH